jgi:hypothetical protein
MKSLLYTWEGKAGCLTFENGLIISCKFCGIFIGECQKSLQKKMIVLFIGGVGP